VAQLPHPRQDHLISSTKPLIHFDPARVIATCLKPADGDASGGLIVRFWEIAGEPGPLAVSLPGFRRAFETDLLERDLKELRIEQRTVAVDLRPRGLGALRLLP